jgi:hypothetical protein
MQFTGHPKTESAGLAFGVRRFEIADMTYPGGFFHFTLCGTVRHLPTYAKALSNYVSIMTSEEHKGKSTNKGISIFAGSWQAPLDPSA